MPEQPFADGSSPTTLSEQSRLYDGAARRALADPNSTAARVLAQVPHSSRVLELGTSTGYMSQALAARGCAVTGVELDPAAAAIAASHCERMIVGNLDDEGIFEVLEDERFDVVLAADVIEHLKDPVGVLRRATQHLRDDGIVVASVPNIAHVSVRIALAQGRFPYGPTGLLDRTHLQFFDRERLFDTFERGGVAIVRITPHVAAAEESSVPWEDDEIAAQIVASAKSDPDATAYQFIVVARRMDGAALGASGQRLRELVAATAAAESRAAFAETALAELRDSYAALERQNAHLSALDLELRALLRSAHEQLAERDVVLHEWRVDAERVREGWDALSREAQEQREAREYFEAESRRVHATLAGVTASRAWRALLLLRKIRRRLL